MIFLVFKDSGPLIEDFKKVGLVFIQNNLNNNKSKLIKILINFFHI